jgi:acetyltransferase-like isoleucine patch superfamily enzyme
LGINKSIVIEEDSWIGHGALLLKNAYICEGAIVGAYSIVAGKILPYSVYIGQPAHFLKPRFKSSEDLDKYLEMMEVKFGFLSKYSKEELLSIYAR